MFDLQQEQAVGADFPSLVGGLEVVGPGEDATVLLDLDIRLQAGNDRIAGFASGVFEFEGNAAGGLGQLGRFQHAARAHMHAPVA